MSEKDIQTLQSSVNVAGWSLAKEWTHATCNLIFTSTGTPK